MKIQSKPLAALAGTVTLVAGVALWPSAAGADSDREKSRSKGKTIEFTFVGDRVEEAFIDNGATGLSLGDEFVYTNINTIDGDTSTSTGECTAHQVTTTVTWNCVDTTVGDLGALTSQGSFQLDRKTSKIVGDEATWAITGGTGEFERARGEISFTAKGEGLATVTTGTSRVHLR